MEFENILWNVAAYAAPLLIFIGWLQKRYGKKDIKKEQEPSKLTKMWQKSYIYLIFVQRASLRPKTLLIYWFIVGPILFMILLNLMRLRDVYTLEEMSTVSGYLVKVKKATKGRDYISILDDKGEKNTFILSLTNKKKEKYEQYLNKKLEVWYANRWLISSYKEANQIKYKDEILKPYPYEAFLKAHQEGPEKLWWWIKVLMLPLLWIWYLNKKELPIHRLNRLKKYKKSKEN